MPVYTIETPGGHKLDIEAADQPTAIKGAQEWYSQNGSAASGIGDALRQGVANVGSGVGETLKQTGIAPSVGSAMQSGAQSIAPSQAPDTALVKDGSVQPSNIPRAIAEQAPGLAASLAAAKIAARLAPGGLIGKTVAGLGAGALAAAGMTFGNRAKENAAERTGDPNAEPNTADKTRAGLTEAAIAPLNMLSVNKFLPGSGKVVGTGLKGAGQAITSMATRVGENAVAGAGQSAVGDVGRTIGTDKGISIDPEKAANAALTSGVTAGALATPKALSDVRGAVRDRAFGGENAEATTQVANRIQKQAENDSRNLKNTKDAFSSVTAAKDEIKSELQSELQGLKQRNDLSLDTTNALDRALSGTATKVDFSHIADTTAQDPSSARVVALARQAGVMNKLLGQGVVENGDFKGGIAAKIGRHTGINPVKVAAVTGGGLVAHGLFPAFGIYSAPAVSALGGGWALARGIDRLSGARSPANRFVEKFANGSGVRPDVVTPATAPSAPGSPTGPKIAPMPPSPWGYEQPPSATPDPKQLIQQMRMLEVARNANRKQTVDDAMPSLRQLAATAQPPEQAAAPDTAQPPKDVLTNSRALVRSLQSMQALKQKTLGEQQAQTEANASPMLEQSVGGPEAVANPAAGKRMREMIGTAKALQALRSDPQAQVEAKETAQAETAATKAEAQAAKAADRKAVADKKAIDRKVREEAKTTALAQRLATQATKQATREAAAQAKADAKAVADRVREEALAKVQADKLASKKPKEATAEPKAEPKAEPEAYTPYSDAELTYQGMDHAEVADAKLKAKYEKAGTKPDPEVHARERAAIIRGRGNDEALIAKIASKATGKDKGTLYQVLEELHHRSSRSQTKAMRDHFAAQLPKELGDELRSALNDQWIGRNKHRP
jgi:hypothetical protein